MAFEGPASAGPSSFRVLPVKAPAVTLAATTLASSMILVDQTAVPLATPDVLADLGGATAEGQWILTANMLPLATLMVLGGRLGDLLGLRRVFLTPGRRRSSRRSDRCWVAC